MGVISSGVLAGLAKVGLVVVSIGGLSVGAYFAYQVGPGGGRTAVAQGAQQSSYTVTIESVEISVGDTGSVNVEMVDISGPQTAWDVRITYDPSIVSVVECIAVGDSTCDPAYRADAVRVLGLNEGGLAQDSVLASITFRCESAGDTALTVTSQLLTIEQGPRIETRDGVIVCQDAAEPDGSPSPTSTVEPTLPKTGGGAPSEYPILNRFIYALMATAAGLFVAAGRIRARTGARKMAKRYAAAAVVAPAVAPNDDA